MSFSFEFYSVINMLKMMFCIFYQLNKQIQLQLKYASIRNLQFLFSCINNLKTIQMFDYEQLIAMHFYTFIASDTNFLLDHRTYWMIMSTDPYFQVSLIFTIGEKSYQITRLQESCIKYFQELRALDPDNGIQLKHYENCYQGLTQPNFEVILNIINSFQGRIPQPAKVKSEVARDAVDSRMVEILQKLTVKNLRSIYRCAHYLKVKNLRLCIATFLASKVFITSLHDYEIKKKEFNIHHDITSQECLEFKNRFSFLNYDCNM